MGPQNTGFPRGRVTTSFVTVMHDQLVSQLIRKISCHHVPGIGKSRGIIRRRGITRCHATWNIVAIHVGTNNIRIGEKVFLFLLAITHDGLEPAVPIVAEAEFIGARIALLIQPTLVHRAQNMTHLMGKCCVIAEITRLTRCQWVPVH